MKMRADRVVGLLLTSIVMSLPLQGWTAEPEWWQANREAALAFDFSAALDLLEYRPQKLERYGIPDLPENPGPELATNIPSKIYSLVPDQPDTEGERRLVSRWVLPDRTQGGGVNSLQLKLANHYLQFGELPQTGADLFPELRTSIGQLIITSLGPLDSFKTYHAGVNPITGRFYNTFSAAEWTAGAALVEVWTPAQARASGYLAFEGELLGFEFAETNNNPKLWLHLKIWGQRPGTVLYDNAFPLQAGMVTAVPQVP
jgi:hypothetical protein